MGVIVNGTNILVYLISWSGGPSVLPGETKKGNNKTNKKHKLPLSSLSQNSKTKKKKKNKVWVRWSVRCR